MGDHDQLSKAIEPAGDQRAEFAELIERLRRADICTTRVGPDYINVQFTVRERDQIIAALASAHLIAPASDMLAALRDALDELEAFHRMPMMRGTGDRALQSVRAAIAEAEGKS